MPSRPADEDWGELVESALKLWRHTGDLIDHPLTDLGVVQQRRAEFYRGFMDGSARALRDILRSTIRLLGVEGTDPPAHDGDPKWLDFEWRHYNILTLRYIKGQTIDYVVHKIGIEKSGHYYREQRKAIDHLATFLRASDGFPDDGASTIALFYPSGAMKIEDSFYIRRKADTDLEEEVQLSGITATIRGPRQVGKTSLLVRGINEARQLLGAKIVYLDLQGIDSNCLTTYDSFMREFAEIIFNDLSLESVHVEEMWRNRLSNNTKLTNLIDDYVLEEIESPILLAMDEIDQLMFTDYHRDFFGLIRSWNDRRGKKPKWNKLSLLMVISTEPYLLIKDLLQSPFNVGLRLALGDFSFDQVVELNHRYGDPLKAAELAGFFFLLNGHPYLTCVGLYTLLKDNLTWNDLESIGHTERGPFREHLWHQQRLIARDTELRKALKQIIRRNECPEEKILIHLAKAGIVIHEGDRCVLRCELYRKYFANNL